MFNVPVAWESRSHPLIAAVATQAARPATLQVIAWIAGGVGALGFAATLAMPSLARNLVLALATAAWALTALVSAIAGLTTVASQTYQDRVDGALDQHRLAGLTARKQFVAYLIGPQWVAFVAPSLVAVSSLPACIAADAPGALVFVPASVVLAVMQLVLSVAALRLGLTTSARTFVGPRLPQQVGALALLRGFFVFAVSAAALIVAAHHTVTQPFAFIAAVLFAVGIALDVRRVLAHLDQPERAEARETTNTMALFEALRVTALTAAVAHVFDRRGEALLVHGVTVLAVGALTATARMPKRNLMRRWRERGGDDLVASLGIVLSTTAFAAAELCITARDLPHALELSIVIGAAAITLAALVLRARVTTALPISLATLAVGGAVFALPVLHRADIAGAPTLRATLRVLDAVDPTGALWGRSELAWAPFVRGALCVALVTMVLVRLHRAESLARGEAMRAIDGR